MTKSAAVGAGRLRGLLQEPPVFNSQYLSNLSQQTKRRLAKLLGINSEFSTQGSFKKFEADADALLVNPKSAGRIFNKTKKFPPTVAAVVAQFGGCVNGAVLMLELVERKLVPRPQPSAYFGHRHRNPDLTDAAKNFAIIMSAPDPVRAAEPWHGFDFPANFGRVGIFPGLLGTLEKPKPLEYAGPICPHPATSTGTGSIVDVVQGMDVVFAELEKRPQWFVTNQGFLAAADRKAIRKAFGMDLPQNKLPTGVPKDLEVLYFELLATLGIVRFVGQDRMSVNSLRKFQACPAELQGHLLLRTWFEVTGWMDRLGMNQRRDRAQPYETAPGQRRRVLCWALGRLARSNNPWVEVDKFLCWLRNLSILLDSTFWSETASSEDRYYCSVGSEDKSGPLAEYEVWMVDAVVGTLFHFGMIERGVADAPEGKVDVIRLSDLGQSVLGAPDVVVDAKTSTGPFLIVQPNFEIVAEQTGVDATRLSRLARMSDWSARTAGHVRTCKLTHAAVFRALEAGDTVDGMLEFLAVNAKHPLPTNVESAIREWATQRERVVVWDKANLLLGASPNVVPADARRLSGSACLISESAAKSFSRVEGIAVADHALPRPHLWTLENGSDFVQTPLATAIDGLRLSKFARSQGKGRWVVDWDSLKAARLLGVKAVRIEHWLIRHLNGKIPVALKMQLSNLDKPMRLQAGTFAIVRTGSAELANYLANLPELKSAIVGINEMQNLLVREEELSNVVQRLRLLGFDVELAESKIPSAAPPRVARKSRTKKSEISGDDDS